jgi:hypothetical protein
MDLLSELRIQLRSASSRKKLAEWVLKGLWYEGHSLVGQGLERATRFFLGSE